MVLGGRLELVTATGKIRTSTPFAVHAQAEVQPTNAETLRRVDQLLARSSNSPEAKQRLLALRRLVEATESGDVSTVMAALRNASNVAPAGLKQVIQKTVNLGRAGREIHAEYPLASGARVRTVRLLAASSSGAMRGMFNVAPDTCAEYEGTPLEYVPISCGGEVDPDFDASPYEPDVAAQAAEGEAISAASDALAGEPALSAMRAWKKIEEANRISSEVPPACRGERSATIAAALAVAYQAAESLYWGVVVKNPMAMFKSILKTGGLIGAAWVAYEFERACYAEYNGT